MDANPLLGPRTGIGQYTFHLIDQLLRLRTSGIETIELLVNLGWRNRVWAQSELDTLVCEHFADPRVRLHAIRLPGKVTQLLWRTIPRTCTQRWIPKTDLFHGVNFWLPPLREAGGVITVHDLGFIVRPDLHTPTQRAIAGKLARSLGRCRQVIVVSEHTRRDFLRFYRFPAGRVSVIHLAAGPSFRPITDPLVLKATRARLGLPQRFILSVATLDPRKNLPGLIRAFHLALVRLPTDCKLVLAGATSQGSASILSLIRTLGLSSRVHLTGYVSEGDLPALYNLAACLVYPSYYEGFGLPVLEAMACGVPVVCSNVSSLPEIAGDAARLIAPDDIPAIAEAMMHLVHDPTEADRMRERGLRRAGQFSWEQTARRTLDVYRSVLLERAQARG